LVRKKVVLNGYKWGVILTQFHYNLKFLWSLLKSAIKYLENWVIFI
jgi:hypothetical protein